MEDRRLLGLAGTLVCICAIAQSTHTPAPVETDNIKNILIWGDPGLYPSSALGDGTSAFVKHKCPNTNCFVTSNKKHLKDITDFDVIVFNGRDLKRVPEKRIEKQKYAYLNMESSHYYPVCNDRYNDFFNWTWTYKLNSDSWWGYVQVYDLDRTVVGPKIDMHWSELGDLDNQTKETLRNKSVAAAWFVSNCNGKSGRSQFAHKTRKELEKHGHSLHIYGYCGTYSCPRSTPEVCNKLITNNYFFYFAFENSFADDYVTEKVLTGLQNYAVPVVFGTANYSRFLPPGSYLDARELGPERLAQRMASIIKGYKQGQPNDYYEFFKWRSRYIINQNNLTEPICKLCSDLQNPEVMSTQTVHKNFTSWWNSDHATCKAQTHGASVLVLVIGRMVLNLVLTIN